MNAPRDITCRLGRNAASPRAIARFTTDGVNIILEIGATSDDIDAGAPFVRVTLPFEAATEVAHCSAAIRILSSKPSPRLIGARSR